MYSEYLTDIDILCSHAKLTEEEREAVTKFARENCDKLQVQEGDTPLVSAFQKFKDQNLFNKFIECIITPKSWNTDFDGENGIPD